MIQVWRGTGHIVTFLRNKEGRWLGPEIKDVTIKVTTSPPRRPYTRRDLEDLSRVSGEDDKFLWRFFLGTRFRENETSVAEVTDINHNTKSIRVDEKPWFKFKPKDCNETLSSTRKQGSSAQTILRVPCPPMFR